MTYDRQAALARLAEIDALARGAEKALADLRADATQIANEIAEADYHTLFDEVTSKPLDWAKLCWPTESEFREGDWGATKLCLVCRRIIGVGRRYFDGGPVGSFTTRFALPGRGLYFGPRLYVHKACVPQRQLDLMSVD